MSEIGRRLVKVAGMRVEVETFEVPEPGPGEVLMRVHRSQVSAGSERNGLLIGEKSPPLIRPDLAGWKFGGEELDFRRFTGYTTVGRVLAAGAGMEEYKPGDRVLASGIHSSHWLTPPPSDLPSATSGAKSPLQRIEYDITDEQAAFATLGNVAIHGVRRAELEIDKSVAVFGQGVVGQLVTACCRLAGAYPVVAVDLDADRLALAKQSGATHTVDASKENAAEAVRSITDGGAQSVIHASGSSKTLVDCMEAAGDRGIVVIVSSTTDTRGNRAQEGVAPEGAAGPWLFPGAGSGQPASVLAVDPQSQPQGHYEDDSQRGPEGRPSHQPRGKAGGGRRAISENPGRTYGVVGDILRLGRRACLRVRATASRLPRNRECRGAKPLCRESEGVPQILILSPFLAGRGPGGWSKGCVSTL